MAKNIVPLMIPTKTNKQEVIGSVLIADDGQMQAELNDSEASKKFQENVGLGNVLGISVYYPGAKDE